MDFFTKFPVISLPIDRYIDRGVDWLTVEGGPFFDAVKVILLAPLLWLDHFLVWVPWPIVLLVLLGTAFWVKRSTPKDGLLLATGILAGMVFIGMLGLWEQAMKTLAIVIAATVLALLVGIPIGIAMARNNFLEAIVRPVLDMLQTMPSFVYLIPALMLFGLGKVPALLSTFIYAVPPAIRLTNLGIRQVAPEAVEAGKAFGSTPGQLLMKVQLPLAMPTIMTGVNQTIMMALSMVVVASMIGAGGLGNEVLTGISQLKVGRGLLGGLSIVVLAIIIDRFTQSLADSSKRQ